MNSLDELITTASNNYLISRGSTTRQGFTDSLLAALNSYLTFKGKSNQYVLNEAVQQVLMSYLNSTADNAMDDLIQRGLRAYLTAHSVTPVPRDIPGLIQTAANYYIANGAAPSISGTPTAATVGAAYTWVPATSGLTAPLTYALTAGTAPTGTTFSTTTGGFPGTPTTVQTQTGINIQVTDSAGPPNILALSGLSIVVSAAFALTNSPSTTSLINTGYSYTPTTTGGRGAVTWAITGKPSWASFNTSTGALTGTTPGTAETDTGITITGTDADGRTVSTGSFTITVSVGLDNLTSYEGLVAARCRRRTTVVPNKEFNARTVYKSNQAIHSLKIAYENFMVGNSTPTEDSTGLGTTRVYASVEYPAGTFTQILWSGVDHSDIVAGDLVISDYTLGDINIPANTDFWIRSFESSTNAGGYAANSFQNTARGELFESGNIGTLTNKTMSGTIGAGTTSSAPMIAIIGTSTKNSVITVGDSKLNLVSLTSLLETTSTSGAGYVGEIVGSFPDETIPFVNLTRPGGQAQNFDTFFVKEKLLLPFASDYVNEFGINDIFIGGRTSSQVAADNATINAEILAAHPHAGIMMTTIGPKATSVTGAWNSTGDQTTNGSNSTRITYNNLVRASSITGQDNGFAEVAWNLESAHDSGLWRVHPTLFRTVVDGVISSTVNNTQLTSATAAFTSADIGLGIGITGAGPSGGMKVAAIKSVTNGTTVILDSAAITTVGAATTYIGQMTTDGLHEQPMAIDLIRQGGGVPIADFVFPDTKPKPFTFTAVTNKLPSTVYTSNTITVTGIKVPSTMTISGGSGQFQINGGSWSNVTTTVSNGDTVAVRGTSSSSFVTTVNIVLTIGGVSGTYAITTQSAFGFVDEVNAALSTVYTSNTVVLVAGGSISITGAGGQYQVNGGSWVSGSGSVSNGDTVAVRNTSSGSVSTNIDTTLTVGSDSDTYTITTVVNSEASAFILRITTDPGATRRGLMDAVFTGLKNGPTSGSNLLSKMDVFKIYAAKDSQSALLNWKSSSFNSIVTNAPTFTVDRGYTGNGTNSYIDEGIADNGGTNWLQDSAYFDVYINSAGASVNAVMGTFTSTNLRLIPYNTGSFASRIHGTGISTGSVSDALGTSGVVRTGSTNHLRYRNGIVNGSNQGTASSATVAENIFTLRANATYSDHRVAATSIGGKLTATEAADIHSVRLTYLTALGAN